MDSTTTDIVAWLALHELAFHHAEALQGAWEWRPDPDALLRAPRERLACADAEWAALTQLRTLVDWRGAARQAKAAAQRGVHIITRADSAYPAWLAQIPDPPLVLFVCGHVAALHALPCVAVVGTRKPTDYGVAAAQQLSDGLVAAGATIVSGLAFGIDRIAHQSAVAVRAPTIAVLASGVDTITPRSHTTLAAQIIDAGGAIASEYPPGTDARDFHFPRRNRLISGLSQGVVIVEGKVASGTMWTARHAMEQGRPVCAVPGPIGAHLSAGPHALIRDGAILVESAAQILDAVLPLGGRRVAKQGEMFARHRAETGQIDAGCVEAPALPSTLWAALAQPCPLDQLIEQCDQPVELLLAQLTALELAGHIEHTPRGYQRVSP